MNYRQFSSLLEAIVVIEGARVCRCTLQQLLREILVINRLSLLGFAFIFLFARNLLRLNFGLLLLLL